MQSAQLAGFLELNAQLVELHRKRRTGIGHNASGDYGPCAANPVVHDDQGYQNHLPCPCENPDTDDLEGRPGPTLVTCPPALLQNLKRELEKFSNLNIVPVSSDYHSPWAKFTAKSERELEEMSRTVFLVSNFQVISANCLANSGVSKMVKLKGREI